MMGPGLRTLKHDGYRMLARRDGELVRVPSGRGLEGAIASRPSASGMAVDN
jgi:hypothetical protein